MTKLKRFAHAILGLGLLSLSVSCLNEQRPVEEDTTPDDSSSADADESSCTEQVSDHGQKGSVAGVARGLYSDTKMVPGTSLPATAFVDQSAGALKFSNWDGSKF